MTSTWERHVAYRSLLYNEVFPEAWYNSILRACQSLQRDFVAAFHRAEEETFLLETLKLFHQVNGITIKHVTPERIKKERQVLIELLYLQPMFTKESTLKRINGILGVHACFTRPSLTYCSSLPNVDSPAYKM